MKRRTKTTLQTHTSKIILIRHKCVYKMRLIINKLFNFNLMNVLSLTHTLDR